jgi:hypothetical protein
MWANFFLSHQVVVMSHRNVALEPLHLYFHRLDDWYPSLGNHILSGRSDQHLISFIVSNCLSFNTSLVVTQGILAHILFALDLLNFVVGRRLVGQSTTVASITVRTTVLR